MLVLGMLLTGCITGVHERQPVGDISTDMVVRGKVRKIFADTGTLIVKPFRGDLLTLTITGQTELKGYASVEHIEKNNRVQVTYRQDESRNNALLIEKLPAGGCY